MGARVPRGAIPLSLTILAAALLWFGLFIAGPWFLRNPPGPNNPGFAWYAAFHFFPFALFGDGDGLRFFAGAGLRFDTDFLIPAPV